MMKGPGGGRKLEYACIPVLLLRTAHTLLGDIISMGGSLPLHNHPCPITFHYYMHHSLLLSSKEAEPLCSTQPISVIGSAPLLCRYNECISPPSPPSIISFLFSPVPNALLPPQINQYTPLLLF